MKIKNEVLSQLALAECDGNQVKLLGQMDRKLYLAVNQVLEALGGKWNRKVKAHVFDGDAQSLIDVAIITGEVTTKRDIGFFPTPPGLARTLCADVLPGWSVLEPSAGTGHIVDALVERGALVVVVERDQNMRDELAAIFRGRNTVHVAEAEDFLTWLESCSMKFDAVIMNPPFYRVGLGDHIDHVKAAWEMLKPGERCFVRSVMPASVQFRMDKRHADFRDWVTSHGGTIQSLPAGSFSASGTSVNTCVVTVYR